MGFGGYGPGYGMMGGWGGGMFPFGGLFGLLILVLIIVAVVWFVRALMRPHEHEAHVDQRSAGLAILDERYARGEINRDEYLQKRKDVVGRF